MVVFLYSEFNIALLRKGIEKSTIFLYQKCLKRLEHLESLTYDNYVNFIYSLKDKGCRHSYINNHINAVRHYCTFLKDTGREFDPKIPEFKRLPEQTYNKGILSDEEITKITSHFPRSHFTLFFKTLSLTGARPNEISHITVNDLLLGEGFILIRPEVSKTKTQRYIPIAPSLIEELKEQIKDKKGTDLVFPNKIGKPITRGAWSYAFRLRVKRLGLDRPNVTCYSLRHSFISSLASDENANLARIQQIAGHKKIETTARYIHLSYKQLHKTLNKLTLLRDQLPFEDSTNMIVEYTQGIIGKRFSLTISKSPKKLSITIEE